MRRFSIRKYSPFVTGFVIVFIIAAIIIIAISFGMAKKESSNALSDYKAGEASVQTADKSQSSISGTTGGTASSDVQFDITKIVYSGNISLYTDDYKGIFEKIQEYVVKIGGFVQNSSSSYIDTSQNSIVNSGYVTIRVPSGKFQEVMKEVQQYGTTINASINSTNISQQYQDIKGQLDNLKIQEDRLLDYLKKAEKLQDMLSIESELNRVRTEIDSKTTLLKNWDKEAAYSTIYISISEKKLATNTVKSPFSDILKEIKEGFISSVNLFLNIFAVFIVWIFKLIPFAAVAGAAYLIYIKIKKKKQ